MRGYPSIWDSTISGTFGGATGDSESLTGDANYEELFTPLFTALDVCKTTMEAKLNECANTWQMFQMQLSQIVGANSGQSGSSGNGFTGDGSNAGSGSENGDGSGNSSTIVGAVQEGGALISEALNGDEGWSASFGMVKDSIHEYATGIVDCVESMVEEIINACIEAIEALNMLGEASGSGGGFPLPDPYSKKGHADSGAGGETKGRAHFSGSDGLPRDEKNALVSEYGQPETIVLPNGQHIITQKPTLTDLPKGTVIYNEKQTRELLRHKNDLSGNSYAEGTIITSDGHVLRPIQQGDRAWELQKAFEPLLKKIDGNLEYLAGNAIVEHNRQMEKVVNQLNTNSITTKNIQQPVNNTFNITMPNVTNSTSAEALLNDLQSLATKKFQVNW